MLYTSTHKPIKGGVMGCLWGETHNHPGGDSPSFPLIGGKIS